jgi:hypothetical protein
LPIPPDSDNEDFTPETSSKKSSIIETDNDEIG